MILSKYNFTAFNDILQANMSLSNTLSGVLINFSGDLKEEIDHAKVIYIN